MLDLIEKKKIHSAERFVVPIEGHRRYVRQDVHDGHQFRMENVSIVPYTVRSSAAYKKCHTLNLQTLFLVLGPPQVFF